VRRLVAAFEQNYAVSNNDTALAAFISTVFCSKAATSRRTPNCSKGSAPAIMQQQS